ncbi:hypothetical protein [Kocuria dechangensis]|nr:hypothetical protein [Kocuria dechangensis]
MTTPQDRHPATTPLPTTEARSPYDRPTEQLPPVGDVYDENYYGAQEYTRQPRRRSTLGPRLMVGAIALLVLAAAAIWAVQALAGALSGSAATPQGTEMTPMATTAPMAQEVIDPAAAAAAAAELEEQTGSEQAVGDRLRRTAFAAASAGERRLIDVEADEAYDLVTGLCSGLDGGAEPASAVAGFIDEHSTIVTAVPVTKLTATGIGIQCPEHYEAGLNAMHAHTQEVPEAPAWDWLPGS